ncbi:unnamed protein product [Trifolium pratense]|uniref:Uncharacterized protein n=1 Tax=Trifolium pratense TaxID=57577 RepID=A0ACB0JIB7_TRIPR|nr:unnamed protein product [Trifolium pratense]
MATLSRIGLFNNEAHPILTNEERPTFKKFMFDLLKIVHEDPRKDINTRTLQSSKICDDDSKNNHIFGTS